MARIFDRVEWPVHTERLIIRPAVPEDADAAFAFRSLDSVAEWIGRAQTSREAHAEWFAEPANLACTLVLEKDGEVIGDLYFWVNDAWAQKEVEDLAKAAQAEIGWTLHPDHHGQGLATEAAVKLLEICFTGFGLRRVVAECFAENSASWQLMERIGMRREAYSRKDSLHRSRGWLDGMTYALLADEWAEQQAQRSENRSGSSSD